MNHHFGRKGTTKNAHTQVKRVFLHFLVQIEPIIQIFFVILHRFIKKTMETAREIGEKARRRGGERWEVRGEWRRRRGVRCKV